MNGPHDLGGRANFGAIMPQADEPLFHADWERRVLGLTLCAGALGHWTLDESRHARESIPPALYYSSSYYRIWLTALESLLLRHGEVTREELADGLLRQPGHATERRLMAERIPAMLAAGAPTVRALGGEPRFKPGDRVRTIGDHARGHTRLPGYARDKPGTIVTRHGAHVFPDANAHGRGTIHSDGDMDDDRDGSVRTSSNDNRNTSNKTSEASESSNDSASSAGRGFSEQPQWLYTVSFDGEDLWGSGAEPNTTLTLEAWESYLRAE